jgi:hypothetical protein
MAEETILSALQKQLECYQRLAKLAKIQHDHVQNSRTQDLLLVLSQRQTVLEEVSRLEAIVGPAKKNWRGYLDSLSADHSAVAETVMEESRTILEEITTADRNDTLVLQQRKLNLGKEINRTSLAFQRNKTYAAAAYGSPRRTGLDIQR